MTEWHDNYVSVNGLRLHYYRTGGGKPSVVLAHGITDSGLGWTRLAKALETHFDLIMFDARGHGLSDKPDHGYGAKEQARDLGELIFLLDLQKPAVVGHSMGAVVATLLAEMHPDYISRLVLEDPAWYPRDEDITEGEIADHAREWAEAIIRRKAQPAEAVIAKIREDHPLWDADEISSLAEAKLLVSPNVVEFDIVPIKPWWEIIPNLQCPVLLLSGDKEGEVAITPVMAKEINLLNSDIQIARLAGAGHDVRRDQFARYFKLLREFLSQ
jgi:N-formylmaleamate deformylase